jgi:hypothetical protein
MPENEWPSGLYQVYWIIRSGGLDGEQVCRALHGRGEWNVVLRETKGKFSYLTLKRENVPNSSIIVLEAFGQTEAASPGDACGHLRYKNFGRVPQWRLEHILVAEFIPLPESAKPLTGQQQVLSSRPKTSEGWLTGEQATFGDWTEKDRYRK